MITEILKNKNRSWYRIFFSIFSIVVILIVISYLVVSILNIKEKRVEQQERIVVLQEEIKNKKLEKQKLKAGIEEAFGDESLEKKIRYQGYKKLGEEVVVIKREIEEIQKETEKEPGFLESIINRIFK